VAFGLKREGLPKDQIAQRVGSMLELVQLEAYGKRLPHQLSGGQQQRVALARSLAKRPKVLLLDEPLGALDKKLRERTQFELVNIIRQVGVTCVMVTHDQEEAMTMANRIAVMSKGRVLQVGSAEEVYEHPVNRFVADFIGNVNLLDGHLSVDEADHCAVQTRLGEVHVGHGVSGALHMPVSLAIRPEKIEISRSRPQRSHNVFSGVVREIAYLGAHNSLIVESNDGTRVRITEANTSRHDLSHFAAGEPVFFGWSDSAAVVLRD
jgi:putrescine transport system ATP-binding protein